jgi:hypothetical protein
MAGAAVTPTICLAISWVEQLDVVETGSERGTFSHARGHQHSFSQKPAGQATESFRANVRFAGLSRAVSAPNGLLSRLGKTPGAVCRGAPFRFPLFRRLR